MNSNISLTSSLSQVVLTERGHVTTTKVSTEEGIYRIFILENTNGNGGIGISAIRIK